MNDPYQAIQSLAGDNARLCGIGEAADKLAEVVERFIKASTTPTRVIDPDYSLTGLQLALQTYKQVREGN